MKRSKRNLISMTAALSIFLPAGNMTCGDVFAQSAFDSQFVDYPTYSGDDLEMRVDSSGTHFRLWSPKAQDVVVNLYDNGHTGSPYKTIPMKFDAATGTWQASDPARLYGKFYTFRVMHDGKWLAETPGV